MDRANHTDGCLQGANHMDNSQSHGQVLSQSQLHAASSLLLLAMMPMDSMPTSCNRIQRLKRHARSSA
eukprot:1160210-Pelagomonas_calceolata.AAC.7